MNDAPNFSPEEITRMKRMWAVNKRCFPVLYIMSATMLINIACLMYCNKLKWMVPICGVVGFTECALADVCRRQNRRIRNILDIINDKSR